MSGPYTFRCPDCGATAARDRPYPSPKCYECIPLTAYTSGHYIVTGANKGHARAMVPVLDEAVGA